MIVERYVSPDGVLTFVVECLDDGVTLLGFVGCEWHTHPSLLDREDGATDEATTRAFIDRLLCGVAVVGVRRQGGAIVDARIMDYPAFEMEALAEGETLEMRYWDGRPWSPTQAQEDANIYAEVPGGPELVRYFGCAPRFHDGEILGLHLDRDGPSTLRIHGWIATDRVGPDRAFVLERHAVVTFTLSGIMDLRLKGFSIQNVIGGLILRRAPDRPERRGYLALDPAPDDIEIEIELEPCYGLDGLIRARSVAITFEPGKPGERDTDADGDDGLTAHVRHMLRRVWDPIDLGARGPEDEYDDYVPDLVALARDTAVFECALVAHLARIEVEAMQLTLSPAKRTRAARALLGLRQAHLGRTDRLVAQWTSLDGLRCAWMFETSGGQYAYEDGVLRHEDDENGSWSWWDGTSLGRSGLYETAEAAARDAHAVIGWLRAGDLGASASVAMPWRDALAWRALDPRERAVLDRLLAADFPGRNELAAQARTALVRRIDDAGSLRFRIEGAPAAVVERVPAEGHYRESEDPSAPGVNLLLHVVGGRLHELEVFKDDGMPIRVSPFEVPSDRIEVWPN